MGNAASGFQDSPNSHLWLDGGRGLSDYLGVLNHERRRLGRTVRVWTWAWMHRADPLEPISDHLNMKRLGLARNETHGILLK